MGLSRIEAAERVVEIWVPGKAYGSGYRLTNRLILTAHHVVECLAPISMSTPPSRGIDASSLGGTSAASSCRVRTLAPEPGKPFHDAVLVWYPSDPRIDSALLFVIDDSWSSPLLEPTSWADLSGVEPVLCTAIGFPEADIERVGDGELHESRQIYATIPPLSLFKQDRWAVQVEGTIGKAVDSQSSWSGMSGAALFSRPDWALLGVVQSDEDPKDSTRLELSAQPVKAFADDQAFVAWLFADGSPAAWRRTALGGLAKPPKLTKSMGSLAVPTARPEGIIGRKPLMDEARKRLLGNSNVALLSGLPGVGKTAIAISLARDPAVVAAFPDGQLWLPVGRQGAAGLSHWVHRMSAWAPKLGISADRVAKAQSDEDGSFLAPLVHEALGDARCLLVFDDVWLLKDALIFKDLGANCLRLLTTRIPKVATSFAQPPTAVSELDEISARALIERHCPGASIMFGERLNRVLQALGGLPLSIVLVGLGLIDRLTEMGKNEATTFLDDVLEADRLELLSLDNLSDDESTLLRGPHRTLQAVIGLTANSLNPDELQTLRALTAFPPKANTFGRAAGEYVGGGSRQFKTLRANGLIELNDAILERFSMHQAIVDFARRDGEDPTAHRRMVEYFLNLLNSVFKEENAATWVEILKPEGENLRTALEWTIKQREGTLGLRLMTSLWPYWYRQSLFQRARVLADQILALPQPPTSSPEEQLMRAKLLNDNGNYAYNMAELQAAEAAHRQALKIRQELGEEDLVAGSLNNIALVLRERGQYDEAMRGFNSARDINKLKRHKLWRLWLGMNLNNIGVTLYRQGEFEQAWSAQNDAAETFDAEGDEWGVAMARTDSAFCLIQRGRFAEAENLIDEILSNRWKVRDNKAVAAALRARAALAHRRKNLNEAQTLLLAALALSEPLADRLGEGRALENIAVVSCEAGDFTTAARALGALLFYQEDTGIVPAPFTASRIAWTRQALVNETTDYQDILKASHGLASQGLINLRAALGDTALRVVPEDVVGELLTVR